MLPTKSDVLVLIPAYNEEAKIAGAVGRVKAEGYDVLVVDDGSGDATPAKAREAGARLIQNSKNSGKGHALRAGFSYFLSSPFNFLITMDADGQHDPKDLEKFLKAHEESGAPLLIGNRMENPTHMPWVRVLTNHFLSSILSLIGGQKIPDSQCGYRLITKEALRSMHFKTGHFEIESEMLLEALRLKLKVRSVSVSSVYEGGSSHIHPIRDTFRFFRFLFSRLLE